MSGNRIIGLDVLRSIAILAVIFGHAAFLFNPLIRIPILGIFIECLVTLNEIIAFLGVEIFFVLSGFLISQIIHDTLLLSSDLKSILKQFYSNRWLRTLPNYYLFVIINIFIYHNFSFSYLLFVQNLFNPHPIFFKEAWSLAIEEWFYLLFPIIMCLFHLKFKIKLSAAFIFSIVLFILFSIVCKVIFIEFNSNQFYNFDEYFRKIVAFRFDSIAIGILGFWVSNYKDEIWLKYKSNLSIVSLFLFVLSIFIFWFLYKNNYKLYFSDILLYKLTAIFYTLIWAVIILGFFPFFSNFKKFNCNTFNIIFSFISKISYSLYLCNLPVLILFKRHFFVESNDIPYSIFQLFAYYGVLILISSLIYKYYEKVFMSMRKKIIV